MKVTKPALLTVDDDPEVLSAIQRDLRERYADRYRILRAESEKPEESKSMKVKR